MKRDWKYILYLSLAFGLFLFVKLMGPKDYDWTPTYAAEDKNPFGAYVLNELLPSLFKGKKVRVINQTVYELKDSVKQQENIIVIAHSLSMPKEDTEVLLKHAEQGATILISAQSFRNKLADTLKLSTYDYLLEKNMADARRDTSFLKFVNPRFDTSQHYVFKRDNVHNYFARFDSTRTTIIAENNFHQPITIRTQWGKGNFILNCTPLVFTNIYALRRQSQQFVATTLSHLPVKDVYWTEYYSVGRLEASTPLRFILTHEPLAWAYYILVISLLLFMIFESKRKQRIIPILPPLENTSLEFVGTIGNLYYQRSDHKNIAEKKILFFFEQLRSKYMLNPASASQNFALMLAKKSGRSEEDVNSLLLTIDGIRKEESITAPMLIDLNAAMEKFNDSVHFTR